MRVSEECSEENIFRHADCVYPLYDLTKAKEMFEEGTSRGWFSERVKDFEGTLKERPREVKELVRRAGLTDVRSLAQAGSMLVQAEAKERERLVREQEGDLDIEGGLAKLLKKNGKKHRPRPAPTAVPGNTAPPVMVNVIFETNHPQDVLPPLRSQAKTNMNTTRNGQRSPTDQENFQERRIMFEKKRLVKLPPLPPAPSPSGGTKRKSGGGGDRDASVVSWGEMNWGLDGAGDWDIDSEAAWDVPGDAGDGGGSGEVGNKKMKTGDELARGVAELLAEFMY